MSFPRDSAVQALMRTFVIVEGEVALEPPRLTQGGVASAGIEGAQLAACYAALSSANERHVDGSERKNP